MIELKHHHDGLGLTELCTVKAVDEPHPVNKAHHHYTMERELTEKEGKQRPLPGDLTPLAYDRGYVLFQRGPRDVADSTPGILDGCLLSVLIHRYECFQQGPFACDENAEALRLLNEALDYIKARAHERAARGVLGKNKK